MTAGEEAEEKTSTAASGEARKLVQVGQTVADSYKTAQIWRFCG